MHKKLPQSTVKLVLPSNESYESKTACNRTLATVLWVPLRFCQRKRHINFFHINFPSAAEKRGLWEGVVQEPLRRALLCVFLCSEVIFSCKSHRNFFQKLPLQCRHFLENPLAKNPKTQLLILCRPSSPGLFLGQTRFVQGTNPVKSGFHCVK